MSDIQTGQPAGGEAIPVVNDGGTTELNVHEAARMMAQQRAKLRNSAAPAALETSQPKSEPPVSQPAAPDEAPAADESAPAADANPDEGHGEQTQEAEAAEPPIDPPVSWTTAEKERWQSIPRATQEYIQQREIEREKLLTQKSKEAEEQLKGLSAREQAMEQQRLQMEAINRAQLQALHQQLQGEFADIRDEHDMQKLAAEDPFRFSRWQAHQSLLAVKSQQEQEAQRRQAEAAQSAFTKFAQEQDKKFVERVPEFADKEKASKLQSAAVKTLTDIGFSQEELARHWNGQEFISLRDARLQEAFFKAARYDEAQAAAKKTVANKTLPPVQRPGVAQSGTPSLDQDIKYVHKQMRTATGTRSARLATALMQLNRGQPVKGLHDI